MNFSETILLKEVKEYFEKNPMQLHCLDTNGMTALQRATKAQRLDIIQYLINQGVNVYTQASNGWTVFDLIKFPPYKDNHPLQALFQQVMEEEKKKLDLLKRKQIESKEKNKRKRSHSYSRSKSRSRSRSRSRSHSRSRSQSRKKQRRSKSRSRSRSRTRSDSYKSRHRSRSSSRKHQSRSRSRSRSRSTDRHLKKDHRNERDRDDNTNRKSHRSRSLSMEDASPKHFKDLPRDKLRIFIRGLKDNVLKSDLWKSIRGKYGFPRCIDVIRKPNETMAFVDFKWEKDAAKMKQDLDNNKFFFQGKAMTGDYAIPKGYIIPKTQHDGTPMVGPVVPLYPPGSIESSMEGKDKKQSDLVPMRGKSPIPPLVSVTEQVGYGGTARPPIVDLKISVDEMYERRKKLTQELLATKTFKTSQDEKKLPAPTKSTLAPETGSKSSSVVPIVTPISKETIKLSSTHTQSVGIPICFENIPSETTEQELKQKMSEFGTVLECKIDKENKKGMLSFATQKHVDRAKNTHIYIHGKPIHVVESSRPLVAFQIPSKSSQPFVPPQPPLPFSTMKKSEPALKESSNLDTLQLLGLIQKINPQFTAKQCFEFISKIYSHDV